MLELIPENDPRLLQATEPFDFEKGYDGMMAEDLYMQMRELMCASRGIGLAAPQVGLMTRMFVMGDPNQPDLVISVFNPKIVDVGEEEVFIEEGCLSSPGLFIKIKRPQVIRVRYTNFFGVTDTVQFSGMTARIFQHEIDHLEGTLFTSRANYLNLEIAKKQRIRLNAERKKNMKRLAQKELGRFG